MSSYPGCAASSQSLPGATRSYTSFSQAALEAAESRIYGGIHFQFSADAAIAGGNQVGQWVVQAFGASAPPRITFDQPAAASSKMPPAITGQLTSGSGISVSFDGGGTFAPVALDAGGRFSVTPLLPAGAADGPRNVLFAAANGAGQTALQSVAYTLARQGPVITLDAASLQDGGGQRGPRRGRTLVRHRPVGAELYQPP